MLRTSQRLIAMAFGARCPEVANVAVLNEFSKIEVHATRTRTCKCRNIRS